ncbi:unnamed protein product [Fraxinus pennsylvanica]|uniref:Uncharacterized protein n=1 Tax=Fraxinus pennsylvanica TaxID=56036 RepID=A0AAD1ZKF9_9LAMI|nr:unnamed protein product [Fraxinus pennsylvanica]
MQIFSNFSQSFDYSIFANTTGTTYHNNQRSTVRDYGLRAKLRAQKEASRARNTSTGSAVSRGGMGTTGDLLGASIVELAAFSDTKLCEFTDIRLGNLSFTDSQFDINTGYEFKLAKGLVSFGERKKRIHNSI